MLQHSTIPFVGRQAELKAIADFSRYATEGDGLVALWISGEAGIGKSRLIERAIPEVRQSDAIVLRVRYYPDSPSSVYALLHGALSGQQQACVMARLPESPEPTGVIGAIRRLARLRRVILICEDVHAMPEEGERAFLRLLHGLVHEPIGLICTARPGDNPPYPAVLPYVVRTLTLQALATDDLRHLMEHYRIADGKGSSGALLYELTRGIPIVVRSVLPELLEIAKKEGSLPADNVRITRLLREKAAMSISAVVREAVAQLAPDEGRYAADLAVMGELFSEGAGRILLGDDARRILDSLRRKGIVALPTDVPKSIQGIPDEDRTWGFTHSLLHEELSGQTSVDPNRLIALLESGVPLYSNRPLLTLARFGRACGDPQLREIILRALIRQLKKITPENGSGTVMPLHEALDAWFQEAGELLDEALRDELRLALLNNQTRLGMYHPRSAHHRARREELLDATADPATAEQAILRAVILARIPPPRHGDLPGHIDYLVREAEEIVERFPSLAIHEEVTELLASIAGKIRIRPMRRHIDWIRGRLSVIEKALARDPSNHELRLAFQYVAGHLLPLFKTREELADRYELVDSLTGMFGDEAIDESILHSWGHLLLNSGRLREARRALSEGILRHFQERPVIGFAIQPTVIMCEALMGAPSDHVERSLNGLLGRVEDVLGKEAAGSYVVFAVALRAIAIGRMREEGAWAYPFAFRLIGEDPHASDSRRLHDIVSDNGDLAPLVESGMAPEDVRPVLDYVAEMHDDRSRAREHFRATLCSPVVNIEMVFEVRAIVALLRRSASTPRNLLDAEARELIPAALRRAIDWCFMHEAFGLIPPLLRDARDVLPAGELNELTERLAVMRERIGDEFGWSQRSGGRSELPLLKMLGSIAVISPDGSMQRVQGARGRRILGLMIANSLMDRPQSSGEFRAVAAEGESDGANTVRVAIARLRTMLGKDAIITSGRTAPRLNRSVLRLDMLEAAEALARCEQAIETQKPRTAKINALAALDIAGGDPPYPSLYGEFFEAARLDFELRMRRTIIAVGRFLCREEDYDEAVDLMRRAWARMPNDEAIAEELISILQTTGRNAEAVTVRTRLDGSPAD